MRDLGLFQLRVAVHLVAVAIHCRVQGRRGARGEGGTIGMCSAKGYGILAVLV